MPTRSLRHPPHQFPVDSMTSDNAFGPIEKAVVGHRRNSIYGFGSVRADRMPIHLLPRQYVV